MTTPLVRLENVGLRLAEGRDILSSINWVINEKESWVLFGRNGAGKTRLLEIISGYRFPSVGGVWRFGEAPGTTDLRETRKRIGYVSTLLQEKFYPHELVRNVVASGCFASVGLYEEPSAEVFKRSDELLEIAGLAGRGDDPFGILSDGERQKVITIRAIINKPSLLILDEAAKGLDLAAREDLLALIAKISGRLSLIYVTHHVEEITPVFGSIFILQRGNCIFQGDVVEGITDNLLSKLFERPVHVESRRGRYYAFL